ncbi:hypothetical protein Syun_021581 [Stephania yunnanensis]|uniref:Protein CHUP1, chloroplastic n=1 Tax=Stephania yunnanensis TaxID=152371 RepID=A0AAP0IFV4_9MAGN
MGSETDLERLRSLVNEMQEKQAKLEARLLQCYSLEKQSLKVAKLKKQMKIKTIESKKLNRNIDSLITDHNKLLEKSEQVDLEKKQLENAICRIKELQRKIEGDAKAKVQLQLIENQVSVFQTGDASVRRALKSEHNLELEAISLKRKNKELQLEKRVLAIKQFAAQAKLTYFSNTSERGIISGLRTEADKLRLAREELLEQVEKLQKNRFMMIDEVVYMRWINECLHHELQIHQTSEMKKLSSKTKIQAKLLPNQKEESKCDQDSLSSTLSSDESRQCNGTILPDDSKCEETSLSKKTDLVEKLKRRRRSSAESSTLLTSENSTPRSSSLSSTSTSCTGSSIPSSPEDVTDSKNIVENSILSTSVEMQSHIKSSDTSSLKLRKRRVSFSDLVCSLDSTSPKLAWPATGMIDNDGAAFEDHRKMMASKAEDPSKTIKAEPTSKDTFIPSSAVPVMKCIQQGVWWKEGKAAKVKTPMLL